MLLEQLGGPRVVEKWKKGRAGGIGKGEACKGKGEEYCVKTNIGLLSLPDPDGSLEDAKIREGSLSAGLKGKIQADTPGVNDTNLLQAIYHHSCLDGSARDGGARRVVAGPSNGRGRRRMRRKGLRDREEKKPNGRCHRTEKKL